MKLEDMLNEVALKHLPLEDLEIILKSTEDFLERLREEVAHKKWEWGKLIYVEEPPKAWFSNIEDEIEYNPLDDMGYFFLNVTTGEKNKIYGDNEEDIIENLTTTHDWEIEYFDGNTTFFRRLKNR